VSVALTTAYAAVAKIFTGGTLASGGDILAMNVLMDRDEDDWARDIAALKTQVGVCDTGTPVTPTGALSGNFTWTCATGRVRGSVLLAPTPAPRIQALSLTRATP
jgi:D-alanyl-D-alanine-carboxypeptidase/D-alanyl-D-alanine-endopeptidase